MKRILIVDDEPAIRQLYGHEFEDDGYAVRTAGSAAAAMRLARDWYPDVVLLDVRLGKESGLDLLRRLRAQHPQLRIVLVTAYCGYRDDFVAWLADAFVTKSGDLTELKQVVAQFLAEGEVQRDGGPWVCEVSG